MNAPEIKSEIAHLHRLMNGWLIEGRLDWDTEADMKAEIADLEEALDEITPPAPDKYAPGGLNVELFTRAFGKTPEEEFST